MKTTMNHSNGKSRKQFRMEEQSNGTFMNTQWESWKGEEWTREHRSNETSMSKEECEKEQEEWTETMMEMGFTRT